MTAAALLGSVASTGLQIAAVRQQAKAGTLAAKYNNDLADAEAKNLEATTRENIIRARSDQETSLSTIRARLANSGFQTGTGTASIIPAETAGRFEVGIADAARAASMQAAAMRAKGAMGLWEAGQQAKQAKLMAAGIAIKGITSAFGQYQSAKYNGAIS